jgi:hypothetical protein
MANDSMVPTKLSIYFIKKHGHLSIRIPAYVKKDSLIPKFIRVLLSRNKADAASYLVAELVAEEMKLHATGESLIHPAWSVNVRTMYRTECHARIKNHW